MWGSPGGSVQISHTTSVIFFADSTEKNALYALSHSFTMGSNLENEWSKVFDIHDYKLVRTLPKTEVACCIRSCGRHLSVVQMNSLLEKYPEPMTKQHFLSAMRDPPLDGEAKDKDILTSFQAFDAKETNELSRIDISQMLTTMGDKITAADCESLLSTLQFSAEDKVSIDAFFKHVTRLPRAIRPPMAEVKKFS